MDKWRLFVFSSNIDILTIKMDINMKTKPNSVVQEFLWRNSPKYATKSMETLARMKFPINDRYSFECILDSFKDEEIKMLLITSFSADDFPILSVESSLEKFFDKFQPFPIPFPLVPLPPIELPDFRETPSACEVYSRDFPAAAANCACRTYVDALRDGFNHLQATLIGLGAARRYARTGGCES
jgi:hypothetical protein